MENQLPHFQHMFCTEGSKIAMVEIVSNLCQHLQEKKINLSHELNHDWFFICIFYFDIMQLGYEGKILNHLWGVQKPALSRKITFFSLSSCCQYKHNSF